MSRHGGTTDVVLVDRSARAGELDRLLQFAAHAVVDGRAPFGYLDAHGRRDERQGHPLWITSRMTHVFGLAALLDHPGAGELATSGVDALLTVFRDREHDGWFGLLSADDRVLDDSKAMYEHAFVLLAASTAAHARVEGAETLLSAVGAVVEERFWDDDAGACRESWDRAWQHSEPYRGANSNMHAVEAFLAAGAASGDEKWWHRALRISERVVEHARCRAWRLPEHFTSGWEVQPEYNRERPGDQFRPYGVTVGHLFEWSRLLVHLDVTLPDPPAWLSSAAAELFDTGMRVGWEADGHPGFVYTLDWSDRPVVAERMHWVAIEAALAANVLARRTGDQRYAEQERLLWRAAGAFVDARHGGWHHELAPSGEVSTTVWNGKPDAYHAVQAMLLPDLPLGPSLAAATAEVSRRDRPH